MIGNPSGTREFADCYWDRTSTAEVINNNNSVSGATSLTTAQINSSLQYFTGGDWQNENIWVLSNNAPPILKWLQA
ncbi:MAG: hypothetical protein FWD49_04640 [Firmicutes bacterium]|nr:hypothetical protein [Bacillota bacterium]